MQPTAIVQRWLGGLCGLVLAVGVVAAVTHDGGGGAEDPGHDAVDAAGSTTTASILPGDPAATTITTVVAGGGDPAAGPSTTAAASDGSDGDGGGGPPAGSGTPVPPAVGQYHYTISNDGTSAESIANVDEDPANPTDRLIGFQGASLGLVERYRWQPDGVYVLGGQFTALGDAACQWQPPVLQLKAPVTAGTSWEGTSDCVATTQVGDIAVHASTRTTIVEVVDTDVAGRTRRAARISRDEDQVVTLAANTVRSTAHYDDLVDVATGIVIRSSATARTEGQPDSSSERHLTEAPADW